MKKQFLLFIMFFFFFFHKIFCGEVQLNKNEKLIENGPMVSFYERF